TAWCSFTHTDSNCMIRFMKKLKDLKSIIRILIKNRKEESTRVKNEIAVELSVIDKALDGGVIDDTALLRRLDLKRQLIDIQLSDSKDFLQKSKIKWAIEGDENSKFFHGVINKRRSQLAIRGIFVDGLWCTNPIAIKTAFFSHFANRFKKPVDSRFKVNFQFPKKLLQYQADELEGHVSHDEIRKADFSAAVDYLFSKGSFPYGCNSSFVTLIPKVIDAKFVTDFRPISLIGCVYKVVTKILANRLASIISELISDSQTVFVSGRQILDGPFILDEILQWCKRKKLQAMFFKVDFAKAYDSVRWDYLLDILAAFGFGSKWCNWIRGTLITAKSSILVNGIPLTFSTLMTLCFLENGLVIIFKFKYLGVIVGNQPSRVLAWENIVSKLRDRLSKWKLKTLSIGGRLTLLKSVLGASPIYNMSLFKVLYGVLKLMEGIRSRFFNGIDQSERKIT
nr:RNA-directed DNA polymerase, eukaryota [Tanacetum cinerariifolium]